MKLSHGFTLVELMITMSIVAILSLVLSINFSRVQKDGRDQRRIEDLKAIQNAAEQVFLLSGSYPATQTTPWIASGQTILQRFPIDPKSGSYYVDSGAFSNGGYCFCARLESSNLKNANASWVSSGSYCDWSNIGSYFCVKNQQ